MTVDNRYAKSPNVIPITASAVHHETTYATNNAARTARP